MSGAMGDVPVWVFLAASYLLGSIPFGLILAKAKGLDIRDVGSGNIGATNVARNLGTKLGACVLVLDALKGALPTWFAQYLVSSGKGEVSFVAFMAGAAILGHCYPVWLRFRGGKGVATSLGVLVVIEPLFALVAAVIFAALYAAFRMASVGSVTATISFPVLMYAFGRPAIMVQLGVVTALLIVWKHRTNLVRVFQGKEMKV